MDVISISLTILFGITGIAVSIYCWKHNYDKQKEQNKIIQELNAVQFNDEYSFAILTQIIKSADDKNIDISRYFNKDTKIYPDGKISKNQIMSAIYNMYHNIKNYEPRT